MAGCLGLTDTADDTQRLLDMLSVSWGQSKVLEGTFADYIKAQRHPKGFESVLTTKSSAPLRYIYYLYGDSLTHAFGWSAFLWIRFCGTLVVKF
jgi:hypothetical protein